MVELVGVLPMPRVLLVTDPENPYPGISSAELSFIPTLREISVKEAKSTHLDEWDAAIFANAPTSVASGELPSIHFGNGLFGRAKISFGTYQHLSLDSGSSAEIFEVADNLDDEVRVLIHNSIIPALKVNRWNPVLINVGGGRVMMSANCRPFVSAGDGSIFAGVFSEGNGPEDWFLPSGVTNPILWIRAAFRSWAKKDPGRFSIYDNWASRVEWQTAEEEAFAIEIEEQERELERIRGEYQKKIASITERLNFASAAATNGRRRMLTDAGDSLVKAVTEALETIGFEVHNRDDDEDTKNAKLEDLIVRYGEWEAVVEVRGYKGGAAMNDFLRLSRFETLYAVRNGKAPSASWYIANHFRTRPPNDRPNALAGAEEQVAEFGNGRNGLVIDTRDLFRITKKVDSGQLDSIEAREVLRTSIGRFEYPG